MYQQLMNKADLKQDQFLLFPAKILRLTPLAISMKLHTFLYIFWSHTSAPPPPPPDIPIPSVPGGERIFSGATQCTLYTIYCNHES